jgi:hypothetical protein
MPQYGIAVQDRANAISYVANITSTTGQVVKASPARVIKVVVLAASTGVGGVFDCAAAANTAASNKVFTVPATVGVYSLDVPCATGVTVFPAAGMTLAVSLS